MNINKLDNFKDLHEKIEEISRTFELDYIDAILEYCESNEIDVELVGEIIAKNPVLKHRVQVDAEKLNFMKKTARLPLEKL